ncbi:MAG: chemotaxis protein CheA [Planctomycetes bacterium]|nr:chemotaxis protein CheA [Planctomycetota bacterium]
MNELDSVVKEFLVESYENLDQLDRDLVVLEKDPQNRERLASIFRTIHTIKGTCGFFGFSKLESLTHVGENLLSRLRDGLLLLNPEITSALLTMIDAVRKILACIENTGQEGDGNYSALIDTLARLQEPPEAPKETEKTKESAPEKSETPAESPKSVHPADGANAVSANADGANLDVRAQLADTKVAVEQAQAMTKRLGEVLAESGVIKREDLERALAQQGAGDQRPIGEILVEHGAAQPQDVLQALGAQQESKATAVSEGNIRVDVGLLDKLMNLVGELVLARNQILQFTTTQKDAAFLSTTQRLNLITTELQEGVMKTRMQPIGNVWNRFPRIVRDLAVACGKQVCVEMEGKETELDKTIIEAIKDPLTHVVRNSVDHGIEKPEIRTAAGKPAEGRLFMRAYHEGGQVNIEISDDGAGINSDRVKQKAVQRGLISREQAARMNEREVQNLIFLPGFSTAERVTNVSGRGVGMDVVKTNIEKIGGTVDVQSQMGVGTTLKIKIPLTLAIIPALIVTSGGDRYAIPQVSLLELVRLEGEQVRKGIEMIHGAPVYRLRGRLLPLVYLDRELKLASKSSSAAQETINIVILQADDRQFGLVVEWINDTEEIVVKPLGKQLKGIPLFAGATIMGDGKVALILDVLGIAQTAGVVSEVRDRHLGQSVAVGQESKDALETLLLFGLGSDQRMAIALSTVARLEEIPTKSVERADNHEVVQYRGDIMPLMFLNRVLPGASAAPAAAEMLQVVVYTEKGRSVGLVVDHILDIVETALTVQRTGQRTGILGSAVIQNRVTDVLDIPSLLGAADAMLLERQHEHIQERQQERQHERQEALAV